MFNKLKLKLAVKRMQRKKDYAAADKKNRANETRMERAILWPFRMICRVLRWVWDTLCAVCAWIWEIVCGINVIGLVNLVLLIGIIVLFSMLIMNFIGCNRRSVVVMAPSKSVTVETVNRKNVSITDVPLPIKKQSDAKSGGVGKLNVVPVQPSNDPTLRPQGDGKIYGDVIIESRAEAVVLKNGAHIRGNVYLQNMRKYVLPCGVKIEGNLFLRNLGQLQFCGDFVVTGNIYVSPTSSFGPMPRNARLGGQVIL